jgi:hypothetical protein
MKAERVLWDLTASLLELSGSFAEQYAIQGIGLTDAAVIDYARKLKASDAGQTLGQKIHIWTRDKSLKAHEPDTVSPTRFFNSGVRRTKPVAAFV